MADEHGDSGQVPGFQQQGQAEQPPAVGSKEPGPQRRQDSYQQPGQGESGVPDQFGLRAQFGLTGQPGVPPPSAANAPRLLPDGTYGWPDDDQSTSVRPQAHGTTPAGSVPVPQVDSPQLLPDGTYGWPDFAQESARPEFPDVAPPAGSSRPRVGNAGPAQSSPSPPRKGRRWWVAVVVTLVLVAGGAGLAFGIPQVGVALGLRPSARELATRAATGFLSDWQVANYAGMQSRVADTKDDMSRIYGGMAQRLNITKVVARPGALDATGTQLPYDATVTLDGLGDVSWSSTVRLVEQSGAWKVQFTAGTVYPGLGNGQRLELSTTPGERGKAVDRNGAPLSEDPDLSVNVLGTVKNGVGMTGLERAFNTQLAGRANTQLQIVDVALKQSVQVIQDWAPMPGKTVTTTFDLRMQKAARRALSQGARGKAALVAIDTQTGEVRAMASQPTTGLPAAFSSYYAPGSTFKIITATAGLMNGLTKQSQVACPTELDINGRAFKNAETPSDHSPNLLEAFAESCNTAFINIGKSLPQGSLQKAAELFGFNSEDSPLPISSVGGQIPAPSGATEAAADAIGQGKVETSPLQMASVAAAIASGTWRQPHLLSSCPDCKSNSIPVASDIKPMMRAVVTSGTARDAGFSGEVYGKTGTAEFGDDNPPKTHAWFVGWRGDTAFAVFVEEGAFGGTVAAPIARRFLSSIGTS